MKENVLSNPGRVTDEHCKEYLTVKGKGWVCEVDGQICGFAIADLKDDNIWALFVHPGYEHSGIGRQLHDTMLEWYFRQDKQKVWLSTSPNTRAEQFYRRAGWKEVGIHGNCEVKI